MRAVLCTYSSRYPIHMQSGTSHTRHFPSVCSPQKKKRRRHVLAHRVHLAAGVKFLEFADLEHKVTSAKCVWGWGGTCIGSLERPPRLNRLQLGWVVAEALGFCVRTRTSDAGSWSVGRVFCCDYQIRSSWQDRDSTRVSRATSSTLQP